MEKFKYEKRYWYPHMGPQDVKIWERFIDANPDRFDVCIYDLPVGDNPPLDREELAEYQKNWTYLCKYKCDAIGFKNDVPTIIEVKPRAGLGSIGQAICGDMLYQEYIQQHSALKKMIVTDQLRNDMDWMCEELGIELVVV